MSELIRKLRATGGKGQGGKLKWEAADEIERLRRLLAEVADELDEIADEEEAEKSLKEYNEKGGSTLAEIKTELEL